MKSTSVSSLWQGYDRKAIPLDTRLIKSIDEKYCTTEYVYFNGEATVQGCTRVFGMYFRNKTPNGASIIVMNDVAAPLSRKHVDLFLLRGYHVLLLDYAGKRADKGYYTVYPDSLSLANYFLDSDCVVKTSSKLKTTCWYVWTTVMLRGITFLESLPETDASKINLFGEKLGAFQVWKTAYVEPAVCCGIALNNSGYVAKPFDEDSSFFFQTCLDNINYAQQITVPVLIQVSTNANDNSMDYMNNLYTVIKSAKCKFSISERSNDEIGYYQKDNIEIFMSYFNFDKAALPFYPEIKPRQTGHDLYYDVKVDESMQVEEIELFVSQGIENDAFKNWHSYKMLPADSGYTAKVSVADNREEISAFVNVKYENSLSVSSEIIKNIPLLIGVKNSPITRTRLLYTPEYGLDEWTSLKGMNVNEPVLKMRKSSMGISGVSSISNSLTTYKLGDPSFSGVNKSTLQILLYSKKNQGITFTVTQQDDNSFTEYYYTTHLFANSEWVKLDLSADMFKSMGGTLENWDKIVAFTVESEAQIIVNSLIWIG
jgi:hypothetical protein